MAPDEGRRVVCVTAVRVRVNTPPPLRPVHEGGPQLPAPRYTAAARARGAPVRPQARPCPCRWAAGGGEASGCARTCEPRGRKLAADSVVSFRPSGFGPSRGGGCKSLAAATPQTPSYAETHVGHSQYTQHLPLPSAAAACLHISPPAADARAASRMCSTPSFQQLLRPFERETTGQRRDKPASL